MLLQNLFLCLQLLVMVFWIDICVGKIAFDNNMMNLPYSKCVTPDRRKGNCVHWNKCQSLNQKIRSWDQLMPHVCGYTGFQPRVCCVSSVLSDKSAPSTDTNNAPTNTRAANLTESPDSDVKPTFLPDDCGLTSLTPRRVFGGEEAEKGSWPWMAVVFSIKPSGYRSHRCGGALVTSRHVVTAAHCLFKKNTMIPINPENLLVRIGAHNLTQDSEPDAVDVRVNAVRIHEGYDNRLHTNDIAVLRLNQPVPFTNNTSPVCLPYDSLRHLNLSGKGAIVTGFGATSADGNYSNILMQVNFDIEDQETCRTTYEKHIEITDRQLCAGTLDGSKDSCRGDSGGPLVTVGKEKRFYLVGIVSFGRECGSSDYPGVYTRVTEYLDWLTTKMAD